MDPCASKASSPPSPPRSPPAQVDVAALKENVEELIEAGVHGFVATGTMGEAGSAHARGARRRGRGASSRPPPAACRSSSACPPARRAASLEYAADAAGGGRGARSCRCRRSATAPTRDEVVAFYAEVADAAGCRSWPTTTPRPRGVDMPADADRAHLRGGRRRRRDQGVLGRRAPDPRAAERRRRARGPRRRRRLGARGLRGRRDRLGHRRRRARARASASSSTTPCRGRRAGAGARACTVGCSPSPAST